MGITRATIAAALKVAAATNSHSISGKIAVANTQLQSRNRNWTFEANPDGLTDCLVTKSLFREEFERKRVVAGGRPNDSHEAHPPPFCRPVKRSKQIAGFDTTLEKSEYTTEQNPELALANMEQKTVFSK
jgi:hypothetical protein